MSKYQIVTDATADLPVELLKKYNILVLPMSFDLNGVNQSFSTSFDMNIKEFYNAMRNGKMPSTSQVNYKIFIDLFSALAQEGKDIIYIAFSSALSGTYNTSLLAAKDVQENYPERQIKCFDSLSASLGQGLLVYNAALKKQEGLDFENLIQWLEDNRPHLCHWFTVDDLFHLKRGGRVSSLTAAIGTALQIKPVIHVDNEGRLIPVAKAKGRLKALKALIEHMKETVIAPENQVIFIGHGDDYEQAATLAKMIQQEFKVKDIIIDYIGPLIGAHSGPGTIALFFLGTQR